MQDKVGAGGRGLAAHGGYVGMLFESVCGLAGQPFGSMRPGFLCFTE